jgi:hypothetical protein
MGTSSANPDKLDRYSTDGLGLVETLRPKSNAVTEALGALRSSGSHYIPSLGDTDATLADVVDDWYHLDEFVGDVAQGFFQADAGAGSDSDGVITVDDGLLATAGEIGYADRDEAIAAANEMADELERLQEEGATAEEMDAFIEMAGRGQYDPAFAVTFSERVGAEGYADATAMIRSTYLGDDRDLDDAIPQVLVLSGLLTTALDTLPGIEDGDRHDPSNADLDADQRLSSDFVYDLTTGYQVEDFDPGNSPWWGYTGEDDLSVVLGLSDPPTDVAVDIADNRLTPLLEHGSSAAHDSLWSDEYRDPVVNYATMLGRNQDASAGWLDSGENLQLVLETPGWESLDEGEALAGVVEAALTNPDMRVDVPGAPSYAEGGLIREQLMNETIDFIGGQGGEFDVTNEYLYDALASGVESNMTLIDDRVNNGWSPGEKKGTYVYDGGDELLNTMHFLGDVMADTDAANTIRSATFDYVDDQLAGLSPVEDGPAEEVGLLPMDDVHEAGRMLGTVMEGELASITEAFEDEQTRAAADQKVINFATGWVPYVGTANGVSDLVANTSVGSLAAASPDGQEFQNNLWDAETNMGESIDGIDIDGNDLHTLKAGVYDLGNELGNQQSQGG